jgi:hypothetical protein
MAPCGVTRLHWGRLAAFGALVAAAVLLLFLDVRQRRREQLAEVQTALAEVHAAGRLDAAGAAAAGAVAIAMGREAIFLHPLFFIRDYLYKVERLACRTVVTLPPMARRQTARAA